MVSGQNVMRILTRRARMDTNRSTHSQSEPWFGDVVMHVPTRCARKDTGQAVQSQVNHKQLAVVCMKM